MCIVGEAGRHTRMRLELLLGGFLFWLLLSSAVDAQSADFDALIRDGGLVKWALQQGGILVAFLITLWVYRRDLMRWAEEKKKDAADRLVAKDVHIEILVELVKSNTQQITQLTAAVTALADRRHATS